MENSSLETRCPSCGTPVLPTENFCPQCGAKLKGPQLSTSIGRQIFIYLFSFFVAPLGLYYAFKYLKQPDPKAKKIGIAVIALTLLAIALMIWLTVAFTRWEYRSVIDMLQ